MIWIIFVKIIISYVVLHALVKSKEKETDNMQIVIFVS